jgi:hypothetical protein
MPSPNRNTDEGLDEMKQTDFRVHSNTVYSTMTGYFPAVRAAPDAQMRFQPLVARRQHRRGAIGADEQRDAIRLIMVECTKHTLPGTQFHLRSSRLEFPQSYE